MGVPLELGQLTGPAQKVLSPNAPGPAKLMGARGIIPGAKPADIVTVIVALSESDDPKVSSTATTTLGNRREARSTRSACPLVMGSNVPG